MSERRRLMYNKSPFNEYGRAIIDGYEAIDFGENFDFIIATCNVGAYYETVYGERYRYGLGASTYNYNQGNYTGTENPLSLAKDTARQVMGGRWRMPTKAEFETLVNNLSWEKVTVNGYNAAKGYNYIDGIQRYVYFICGGAYSNGTLYDNNITLRMWSSTPYNTSTAYYLAWNIRWGNTTLEVRQGDDRGSGMGIRGVISKSEL